MSSGIGGPSIRVDQNTTRKDLQDFLVNNTTDGARLLGKKDKTGAITLYTSDKRANLLSRMTGQAAKRRGDAREAVNTVLTSYEQKAAGKGLTSRGAAANTILFKNVADRTRAHDTSALRSGEVRTALSDVKKVVGLLPRATATPLAPAPALPPGPQIADTRLSRANIDGVASMLSHADLGTGVDDDNRTTYSDTFKQLAQAFGDAMATGFRAGRSPAELTAFAMSDGAALKTQLRAELDRAMPPGVGDPDVRKAFVTQAFNRAASTVMPDRATGVVHTITVGGPELPEIIIGGRTFVPKQHLGSGGFAEVYLYEASDKRPSDPSDDSNTLAFKLPHAAEEGREDESLRAAAEEVATHRTAMGQGQDNVIGLKAAIRLPNGTIGVAIQIASGGDADKVAKKIESAIGTGPGKISQDEADILRFAMLKDMAQGLKQIRDNNLIHFDFKTPNCLVSADGTTKISDFGLTKAGPQAEAGPVLADAQNADYISPEMAKARGDIANNAKDAKGLQKNLMQAVTTGMRQILTGATADEIGVLTSAITEPDATTIDAQRQAKTAAIKLTAQSDTFNLGIAAYNLFTGRPLDLQNETWSYKRENVLAEFDGKAGTLAIATDPATGQSAAGALSRATHNTDADDLMNRLMDPVPANRPSLDAVLTSNAFLGFDDTLMGKAHGLIAAIAKGDPTSIDQARADLATLL